MAVFLVLKGKGKGKITGKLNGFCRRIDTSLDRQIDMLDKSHLPCVSLSDRSIDLASIRYIHILSIYAFYILDRRHKPQTLAVGLMSRYYQYSCHKDSITRRNLSIPCSQSRIIYSGVN